MVAFLADEISALRIVLPLIESFAKSHYDLHDDLHGLQHILRTFEHARRIQIIEGGSWEVISAIIWLHDIGRPYETTQHIHHAKISHDLAQPFLAELNLPNSIRSVILEGILAHSFSIGQRANILEAKIVSDADKLDALGAIGIFRACAFQYAQKTGIQGVLQHLEAKLLHLDNEIYLPSSLTLARERIARLLRFKEELLEELG